MAFEVRVVVLSRSRDLLLDLDLPVLISPGRGFPYVYYY